jgi:hypothetical protein
MTKTRWLISLALLVLAGCEGETRTTGKKTAGAPRQAEVKSRPIIGKKTQDVRKLDEELKKGAVLADTRIPVADPATQAAKGYVFATTQLAIDQVTYTLRIYEAEHAEYPKTYEEFMENIIKKDKPDGILLPEVPFYMAYAYDVPNHQLVILKYPELEKRFDEQQDKKLGRK